MKLAVNFAWHVHPWESLLKLVTRAEALGYSAAFVDGDIAMLGTRREADVLDGWTTTVALLARTSRIQVGSLRLVHHWNAARLAQCVATAERITPGRVRFLITIGDRPGDEKFGLPSLTASERIAWLDETLTAIRALWRGDTVSIQGHHVELKGARVRPIPAEGSMAIGIAAAGPRMLELVAAHANSWDINLPAVPTHVERARNRLAAACQNLGRPPSEIECSQMIFCRVGHSGAESPGRALAEYRRLNPWFQNYADEEIEPSLVAGEPAACRVRLAELAAELNLDLPVVDLSGLPLEPSLRTLEELAPDGN
ncbi:LLM class flavin-dependent oxidoreductase [Myxococcota bacterium]|nr:LLM class flavin-dependent oxidoreductase [Myxococcota bacterium]